MNKNLTILAVLVMLLTITFLGTGYSQDEIGCGTVIDEDTTLHNDLTCSGTALIIGADNITLDLNGHTLTGDGTGVGIDNYNTANGAILSVPTPDTGYHNVTIKDGVIDGFGYGMRLAKACNNLITHIEVVNSAVAGIGLYGWNAGTTITECLLLGGRNSSAIGVVLETSRSNQITENVFFKNDIGLLFSYHSQMLNTITENIFKNNTTYDIQETNINTTNTYEENKCKNTFPLGLCE